MSERSSAVAIIHGAERRGSPLDAPELVEAALERITRVVPRERVLVPATAALRERWARALSKLPPSNVLARPVGQGSAAAVLHAFLHAFRRSPGSPVVVVPANHLVDDERALLDAIEHALDVAPASGERVVLLGFEEEDGPPSRALTEVVLGAAELGHGLRRVVGFSSADAPSVDALASARRVLGNGMIAAATPSSLLRLYENGLPELFASMLGTLSPGHTEAHRLSLYPEELARDLFHHRPENLAVLPVHVAGYVHLEQLEPAVLERRFGQALERSRPVELR
ncbi:hypothetical protein L6R52_07835 [Myxococcota bacterium]|nr:hypothetical protein [Myxococcota bacterium]